MSVSVCLSVCLCVFRNHIDGTARVTHGRGSVLLWRRSDTPYIFPVLLMTSDLYSARRRRQAEAARLTRSLGLGA